MYYGAIEMGGTKIICAVFDENGKDIDIMRFPTAEPEEALEKIKEFYAKWEIAGLGIGSFGPVCIDKTSRDYGKILDTPKLLWRNFPFAERLAEGMKVPMAIDTDVNCACMGELQYGAAKGLHTAIYITIGTGVGVGAVIAGETLKGMLHPEAGHIMIRKAPEDTFAGACPYHGGCFEGMAAGPAIMKRCGRPAYELRPDDAVWELEADYIAQAIMTYILTYSPQKIILGGGVMEQEQLFPLIRKKVVTYLGGYIQTKELKDIAEYIVPAGCAGKQGLLGAFYMAKELSEK